MIAIVIPSKNESNRLISLLKRLLSTYELQPIYVVLNGSTDNTWQEIRHLIQVVKIIYFREALGFDVPRAAGAYHAYRAGAKGVLFVDGDMVGDINKNLLAIKNELLNKADLVLTNTYPQLTNSHHSSLATKTLNFRADLNKSLGLYQQIGFASPSHGPVGVSRRLLETIPWKELAVPPVSLALAKKNDLVIKVGTAINHLDLGSKVRHSYHARQIAHTIIGDCLEAKCVYEKQRRTRSFHGIEYLGYHPLRRFDLLEKLITEKPKQ